MTFKHETGAIIGPENGLISIFDGEVGHVDFPDDLIAKLHKMNPGYINRFTHTHPPALGTPSDQDNSMMSNFAMIMYPFPVRLGIIVPARGSIEESRSEYDAYYEFMECTYQWVFEPREIWQEKKMVQNDIIRSIVFEKINTKMITYVQGKIRSWQDWIIDRSYNV